jgi:hypothetical protein
MSLLERAASAIAISLLAAELAAAACLTGRCRDEGAVETVRAQVAATCQCDQAFSHRQYLRCARDVIRAAVKDRSLPGACGKSVKRCEQATTCGKPGAVVCCQLSAKGRAKARVVKSAGRCGGATCTAATSTDGACTAAGRCAPPVRAFRSLQDVFGTSCALSSCHSSLARKGELVLDHEDVSYASLVNRPSAHPEAKAAGLLRVKPGDPENSFLVRKLRGLGPGDAMPQGVRPLAEDTIAMIEDWIARGAHGTTEECPETVDGVAPPLRTGAARAMCGEPPPRRGDFVWAPEPPLEVPAAGEGIQLFVPRREVAPGTEWESCYAFRPDWKQIGADRGLANFRALSIRKQEYRMHEGSHHLLLYAYSGQYPDQWALGRHFPCFAAACTNPADCPPDTGESLLPIGGTQVAGVRYEVNYPQGVGLPILLLSENIVLIADVHYTNPFQPPQPQVYGEAWLNLHFYNPGEAKVLLDGIFAINFQDLVVEPFESKTFSRIWQPRSILTRSPVDAAVFQLFGHMHKRGELFQIDYVKGGKCSASQRLCGRDEDCSCKPYQRECTPGQTCVREAGAEDTTIYRTTEWDNAPVVDFPRPYLLVNKDQGLRWTCTHTNGVRDDPSRPPKKCHEGCNSCGWDAATRTCTYDRGVQLGYDAAPRVFQEGEPIPLVFGELADDDMCNMFGYMINAANVASLPE